MLKPMKNNHNQNNLFIGVLAVGIGVSIGMYFPNSKIWNIIMPILRYHRF